MKRVLLCFSLALMLGLMTVVFATPAMADEDDEGYYQQPYIYPSFYQQYPSFYQQPYIYPSFYQQPLYGGYPWSFYGGGEDED